MVHPFGRRAAIAALTLAIASFAAACSAGAAVAAPAQLWQNCEEGPGAGQCRSPRGVAVDGRGHVFVADQLHARINEFTAWGAFVKAWGYDVVESGPDDSGTGFEVCNVAAHPSNVCKGGAESDGAGGFRAPVGIGVDSAGAVYVYDLNSLRLQKFDPAAGPDETAQFVWAIGRNVNKTKVEEALATQAEKDICIAVSEDQCKGGESGAGPGEFSNEKLGDYAAVDTSHAVYAEDALYVGDVNRIERFSTEGEYKAQIAAPKTVQSLDADSAGFLYVAYFKENNNDDPNVRKLDPTMAAASEVCAFEVANPRAVAVAPRGGEVYVFDKASATIVRFGASCGAETAPQEAFGEGLSSNPGGPTGIAASAACFSAGNGIYFANTAGAQPPYFIRAYGPPPDEPACPPPARAPAIDAQYALSVGTGEAELQAKIDPHYWSGSIGATEYFVRYATAACIESQGWEAECVKQRPLAPARLEAGVVEEDVATTAVAITGLAPGTKYLYRFAAQSLNAEEPAQPVVEGQPVEGVGGVPGGAGKAGAFATFAAPEGTTGGCANEALRGGASASLPDCRAYELVSPVDKNGGDVGAPGKVGLDQAAPGGAKLTYSANRAFGDSEGSPYISQYIAARRERGEAEEGWRSTGLNPPQEGATFALYGPTAERGTRYRDFSGDLGEGWLLTYTEPQLAPGAQKGYANLYRRDSANGKYEACTTAPPETPEGASETEASGPKPLGASADGRHGLFRIQALMTPNAAQSPEDQLYMCSYAGGGPRQLDPVSVLPDGVASAAPNTVGTANLEWPFDNGRLGSYRHAISGDGSRVYWSAGSVASGDLYVRLNPDRPESARLHGAAAGTGDLIGPAVGEAPKVLTSTATIGKVEVKSGAFAVGQEISDAQGAIAAGTEIEAIEEEPLTKEEAEAGKKPKLKLTLTAKPKANKSNDELIGHASPIVSNLVTESGAFEAGQEVSGPGIAPGTTIEAVNESEGTLTLSAAATATREGAALEATSPCTEADAKACTVAVSPGNAARFWDANPEGSEALFSEGESLYAFEVEVQGGEPVTQAHLLAGQFHGIAGASEDLSRVYLVSEEDLDEGGPGEAGQPNLYLEEDGAFAFVAALSASDGNGAVQAVSLATPSPYFHTALASADGKTLAFLSDSPALAEQVVGYDNTDQASGEADAELYRYDATSGELACISCNPGGARPRGRRISHQTGPVTWQAAALPAWETSFYAMRSLSEGGRRVFFESYEPLVLADTDGTADVYEWEAAGEGSCRAASAAYVAASGGCLFLISSGKSAADATFIDASADGTDVFFATARSLVPADPGSLDIYDARVDGGFPEAQRAVECEGEACQGPAPAPSDPTPSSALARGRGNLREGPGRRPCPKGKRRARRKGKVRCVPSHRHRHKHRHHRRAGR